ncbi:MAG: hypothetical protein GX442_08535 [Candidatus Riflebacteria bacterium]|nr:hypothetical protein [Candidatus Riflebacteria bacterium]
MTGRIGTTVVEFLMVMTLFVFILGLVLSMTSRVRFLTGRSTIDLQNLQEARLAVTALRRDFAAAGPVFAGADSQRDRERLRRAPLRRHSGQALTGQSTPILVGERELIFQRFRPGGSAGDPPAVEPVRYGFDPGTGHLTRTTPGQTTVFTGIRDATFKVYTQPANPEVPLLWVRLEVRQTAPGFASGPTLALTTTLRSTMAADLANHPEWFLQAARQAH